MYKIQSNKSNELLNWINIYRRSCSRRSNGTWTGRSIKPTRLRLCPWGTSGAPGTTSSFDWNNIIRSCRCCAAQSRYHVRRRYRIFSVRVNHFLTFDHATLSSSTWSSLKNPTAKITTVQCLIDWTWTTSRWWRIRTKPRVRTQRRWTGWHQTEKRLMFQATFP